MLLFSPSRFPKGILICALLWIGSLCTAAEPKPTLTIDLLAKGLPVDAFKRSSYKECPHQYRGYRTVQWIDAQRLLVGFNTSPDCAKKEGILAGVLRLVVFDLKGDALHSVDISYDAGSGIGIRLIQHDGVWIGPDQTVVVEIPGSRLKAQPNSRDRVVVLSSDLSLEQEIDTDSHENYWDGLHFAGTTADHHEVLFWTSDGVKGHEQKCLLYSGKPLKQAGTCAPEDLHRPDPPAEYRQSTLLPKGYQVVTLAGSSTDGGRVSLLGVKGEGGLCDIFGKSCRSSARLIVLDTATNRLIFGMGLALDGRAALSPAGKYIAAMENNRIEIFSLP
jgi:hypothetical protein